ncbi:MAG TPA: hypothetical protein VMP68_23715 [Candidatus Eisenbacteria bacterium]|nr:hypothetical protein [Candidatus Eisenbacteria bacterium]
MHVQGGNNTKTILREYPSCDFVSGINDRQIRILRKNSLYQLLCNTTGAKIRMNDKIPTQHQANGSSACRHPAEDGAEKTTHPSVFRFEDLSTNCVVPKRTFKAQFSKNGLQSGGSSPLLPTQVDPVKVYYCGDVRFCQWTYSHGTVPLREQYS